MLHVQQDVLHVHKMCVLHIYGVLIKYDKLAGPCVVD